MAITTKNISEFDFITATALSEELGTDGSITEAINTAIATIDTSSYATASELTTLKGGSTETIATLDTKISTNTLAISTLKGGSEETIGSLLSRIAALETVINALDAKTIVVDTTEA